MTHILSFISGSDLSPLMLSGGATLSNPGEGFADLVGSIKLAPANPDTPMSQASGTKTAQGMVALLANETDLSLPNAAAANLLAAAGHSQAEANKLSLGIQPEMQHHESDAAVTVEVGSSESSLKMQAAKGDVLPVAPADKPAEEPEAPKLAVDQRVRVLEPASVETGIGQVSKPLIDRNQPAQPVVKNGEPQIATMENLGLDNPGLEAADDNSSNPSLLEAAPTRQPTSHAQEPVPVAINSAVQAPAVEAAGLDTAAVDATSVDQPMAREIAAERQAKPDQTVLAANAAFATPPAATAPKEALPSKPERAPADNSAKTRAISEQAIPLEVARAEGRSSEAPIARAAPTVAVEQPQSDFAQRLSAASAQISGAAPTEGGNSAVQQASAQTADAIRLPNHAAVAEMHLAAKPGQMGKDLAVQIARHSKDGQDTLTIRLDPAELGRINVRMHFDDQGSLRAHVTAESNLALEMLRRESIDLARALTDAGVRNDAQSFRFDSRGQEGGQQGHRQAQHHGNANDFADHGEALPDETEYRRVRTNGAVDVLA